MAALFQISKLSYCDRPETAARICCVADSFEGTYLDGTAEPWVDQHPRVARLHADDRFAAAFGERLGILAGRIAAGLKELTDPTSYTADEVALHMVIDRAEELFGDPPRRGVDRGAPHRPADATSTVSGTTSSTTSTCCTSTTLRRAE